MRDAYLESVKTVGGNMKRIASATGFDIKIGFNDNPNYNSGEVSVIKGLKSNQIKKVLGYIRHKEIVARKNICLVK